MFTLNKKLCRFLLCIAFIFLSAACFAQVDTSQTNKGGKVELREEKKATAISDTAQKKIQNHSPKKAALLSLVLPGAGQVYNKKYWKVPIIYGAIGTVGYLAYKQQDSIIKINRDLDRRFDGDSTTYGAYHNIWSDEQMLTAYDATAKKRDIFFIVGIALYALQVVDATVDAHLFYFDVSDDLSLKFTPEINNLAFAPRGSYSTGIKLSLTFKK